MIHLYLRIRLTQTVLLFNYSSSTVGTCDTEHEALCYIKHAIVASGSCKAILIDIGSYDPPDHDHIDISHSQVVSPLSEDIMFPRYCARNHDPRPHDYPSRLSTQGSIAGVISAGGSGNTGVCATAFRDAFPIGFPKLLVSTMAPGNTRHDVGETDMTMMYSVVDIAGMNALFHTILGNAAVAIVGMTL